MDATERLEDVLDLCIEDVRSGRRSVEECLAAWPQFPDLGALLRVATQLIAMNRSVQAIEAAPPRLLMDLCGALAAPPAPRAAGPRAAGPPATRPARTLAAACRAPHDRPSRREP